MLLRLGTFSLHRLPGNPSMGPIQPDLLQAPGDREEPASDWGLFHIQTTTQRMFKRQDSIFICKECRQKQKDLPFKQLSHFYCLY